MLRILKLLLIALLCTATPALAQAGNLARPSGFFANPGSIGDADATFFVLNPSAGLNNERLLTFTPRFDVTDNGPGMTYVVELHTVSIAYGGTGGTTQQGAVNGVLGFPGVSAGDTIYYNGTNWVRLPKGADNEVLTLISGLPAWSASGVSAPANSAFIVQALSASLTNERRLQGTANRITTADGGANGDFVLDVGTDVVLLTATQTLTNKTLTGPIFSWNSGNGVTLKGQAFDTVLNWADWGAARTLSIPDPGANASFVMTAGNQTLGGIKTFSSAPVLSTNTLSGNGNTMTFPSSAQTLVGRTSTDTLTNKTLTSPHIGSSFILDQSTANYTFTWDNPAAGRAYHFRDVNTDADVAMTHDTATYTAGGVAYADGNVILFTSAGTSGQVLLSQGAGAPVFGTLGAAGGGTGITSYTAGDILVVNDSNTLVKFPGGSDGYLLTYRPGNNPNFAWEPPAPDSTGFGGDGSDSAVAITTTPVNVTGRQYNATNFSITGAGELYIYEYPLTINATGTITIDGHIIVDRTIENGGGAHNSVTQGGVAEVGEPGGGVGAGDGGVSTRGGGAGASGTLSQGGYGGSGTTAGLRANSKPPHGLWFIKTGGGGGGGTSDTSSGARPDGGSGLPSVMFCAVGPLALQDDCDLFADAHHGVDATGVAGGGAGGAGPNWMLLSQTSIVIDPAAIIRSTGGDGGNGGGTGNTGGAGGGAGGSVLEYAPSVTDASTPNLAGGAAGLKNASGQDGDSGEDGDVVTITGTPNLPIITWLKDEGGMEKICSGQIEGHRDICRAAAHGDAVRYLEILTERTTTTKATCLGIGDYVTGNAA